MTSISQSHERAIHFYAPPLSPCVVSSCFKSLRPWLISFTFWFRHRRSANSVPKITALLWHRLGQNHSSYHASMLPKQHRPRSPLGLTRSFTMKLSKLTKLPSCLKKLRAQVQKPVVRSMENESAVTPEVDSEAIERSILAALEIQSSPSTRIGFISAIRALIVADPPFSIPTPE